MPDDQASLMGEMEGVVGSLRQRVCSGEASSSWVTTSLRLWSDLYFNTQDDIIEKVFDRSYPNKDHPSFINTNDAEVV